MRIANSCRKDFRYDGGPRSVPRIPLGHLSLQVGRERVQGPRSGEPFPQTDFLLVDLLSAAIQAPDYPRLECFYVPHLSLQTKRRSS